MAIEDERWLALRTGASRSHGTRVASRHCEGQDMGLSREPPEAMQLYRRLDFTLARPASDSCPPGLQNNTFVLF